jgi:hypothetical protein
MNIYNSTLAKLLGYFNKSDHYAITLGQTAYYSAPKWFVDLRPKWRKHEEQHKIQWKRDGYIKFAFKYIYYQFKYGYLNNPYEVESREAETK